MHATLRPHSAFPTCSRRARASSASWRDIEVRVSTQDLETRIRRPAEGRTPLDAFDNALLAAGIGNVNLLKISSIVPPEHEEFRATSTQARLDHPNGLRGDVQ